MFYYVMQVVPKNYVITRLINRLVERIIFNFYIISKVGQIMFFFTVTNQVFFVNGIIVD